MFPVLNITGYCIFIRSLWIINEMNKICKVELECDYIFNKMERSCRNSFNLLSSEHMVIIYWLINHRASAWPRPLFCGKIHLTTPTCLSAPFNWPRAFISCTIYLSVALTWPCPLFLCSLHLAPPPWLRCHHLLDDGFVIDPVLITLMCFDSKVTALSDLCFTGV